MIIGGGSLTPYNIGYLDGAAWAASKSAASIRALLESPAWQLVASSNPSPDVEALRNALLEAAKLPPDPRSPR